MKLSAVFLLGVNLVAASHVAANASDTASFLQEALDAPSKPGSAKATPPKGSAAKGKAVKNTRAYVAMSPVIDGVKVRPFVPGRYLPSEAELKAKKQAEIEAKKQAEIARQQAAYQSAGGMLAGQVAYNGNQIFNPSLQSSPYPAQAYPAQAYPAQAYPAQTYPAQAYPMSRPDMNPYVQHAAQTAFHKVKQAAKNYMAQTGNRNSQSPAIPKVPEPIIAAKGIQVPQPPQAPAQRPYSQTANHLAGLPQVPAPPAQPRYDSGQLESILDNGFGNNNADMRATMQGNPGLTGQGPPPYPLNSMQMSQMNPMSPMGQMGQMGQMGPRAYSPMSPMAQRARFGDWHGGNQNLAQASFQSYVPIHTAGPMSVKINHYSGAATAKAAASTAKRTQKTGRQALRVAAPSVQHIHPHKIAKIKAPETKKAAINIACYPAYYRKSPGI